MLKRVLSSSSNIQFSSFLFSATAAQPVHLAQRRQSIHQQHGTFAKHCSKHCWPFSWMAHSSDCKALKYVILRLYITAAELYLFVTASCRLVVPVRRERSATHNLHGCRLWVMFGCRCLLLCGTMYSMCCFAELKFSRCCDGVAGISALRYFTSVCRCLQQVHSLLVLHVIVLLGYTQFVTAAAGLHKNGVWQSVIQRNIASAASLFRVLCVQQQLAMCCAAVVFLRVQVLCMLHVCCNQIGQQLPECWMPVVFDRRCASGVCRVYSIGRSTAGA